MDEETRAVGERGLLILVSGLDERPIDEKRPAYDILARHEPPIAAVEADGAIVAHGEITAWGDDQVLALNVRRQLHRPTGGHVAGLVGRDGREVVPVRKV